MSYGAKKLADVELLNSTPENANKLIEVDGEVKRVPESETLNAIAQLSEEIAEQSWDSIGSDHVVIEWDGNTEGLTSVSNICKVSDTPIPIDALLSGAGHVHMSAPFMGTQEMPMTDVNGYSFNTSEGWAYGSMNLIVCTYVDNVTIGKNTIPEAGVYFTKLSADGSDDIWVDRLEYDAITPIPEKYLPGYVITCNSDTEEMTSNLTYSDFVAAFKQGVYPDVTFIETRENNDAGIRVHRVSKAVSFMVGFDYEGNPVEGSGINGYAQLDNISSRNFILNPDGTVVTN